ncbi:cortactin-binding protein 2-like isoform X2 [Corvus hawaiiensis]|uniref:cortactin-binding protein 2-like isoform X2 n=1 Tax=Corvus hawaiiensis TaxID=134902 RepID=UPI0020191F84|nr:cortactin-binding protein 2-like isoform X2 [Corvus hawaiiensis]
MATGAAGPEAEKAGNRSPMAEPRPGPRGPPSAPSASQLPPPSASQCSQLPPPSAPTASQLPPPSAPSASQCSQLPPPSLGGLVPPSHFVLRPRSLGAELEALRGRGQRLGAELETERGRGQRLEAELAEEKGRGQRLEAELAEEKGRGQRLEAELAEEKGRGQVLEAELAEEKGRGQRLEAELAEERGRGQHLEAELAEEKGRGQRLEAELAEERGRGQRLEAELAEEKGRGQHLEAELAEEKGRGQVLEEELVAWRGRGLGTEGAEPSPEQVLLRRWRRKVLELLLRLSLSRGEEQRLREQAVSRERRRAEVAEEALGELGRALSRLWGSQAELSAALGALGTLSERLERAGHRVTALVASGRLRWQREPEGTAGDSGAAAPEARWHRGGTGGGSVPVSPPRCPLEATKGRDGTGAAAGTGSLGPWLSQLQALGAAILGDSGATVGPPRPAAARGALAPMAPMAPMAPVSPPPRG